MFGRGRISLVIRNPTPMYGAEIRPVKPSKPLTVTTKSKNRLSTSTTATQSSTSISQASIAESTETKIDSEDEDWPLSTAYKAKKDKEYETASVYNANDHSKGKEIETSVVSEAGPSKTLNRFGFETTNIALVNRKYKNPAKAAIIKAMKDDATYDIFWTLCWEVNFSFMTRSPTTRSKCMRCDESLSDSDGSWHSEFVATATSLECGHSSRYFCVCIKCEEDLLFDISTVGVECFEKGCKEEYKVNRAVVIRKLGKERNKLLEEYLSLLDKYRSDTFSCAICLSDVDRTQQPKGKIAPGCQHEESLCCLDCLTSMIDSAVRNAMWGDIKCPECNELMDTSGVKKYSSEDAYTKWEKFQLNKALEGDEEFRWCPGQSFTCGHGQLHPERDSQPRIICSECDTHHCFTCRVEWHKDLTCAQYISSQDISKSEALILKTTKRCPARGCGIPIEKREACLEVAHKSGCNTNFCWDCKAILRNDIPHSERVASRHFASCKALEVRHCGDVTFVEKPPREGNDIYRDGWAEDPEYEREHTRDGAHMYCRGCTREKCTNDPAPAVIAISET